MLHFCYYYRYLLVTNYLAIKLLATYNFSTCRHYLTENYLSFPSAPCWVRHSYLLKRATVDPLYLWVIKRLPVLMTLWRSWYVQNEVYHAKPAPPVEASSRFLCGYINTLLNIQQHPKADVAKGKTVISYGGKEAVNMDWRPREGALQSDGANHRWDGSS